MIPVSMIAIVVAGFALVSLQGILVPLVVAFFLASLAGPLVGAMRRRKIPTALAIVVIILLTALALFLLSRIFTAQLPEFRQELPIYQQNMQAQIDSIFAHIPPRLQSLFTLEKEQWQEFLSGQGKELAQFAAATLGSLFSTLGTLLLILLYMVFILLEREHFLYRLKKAYHPDHGRTIIAVINNIQKQTESYIVGKTIVSLMTGSLATLFLWIMGVKFCVIWGILTFLLNFIPNIGSIIATLLPLGMAAIQANPVFSFDTLHVIPNLGDFIAAPLPAGMTVLQTVPTFSAMEIIGLGVALVAVQFAVGNVVEPRLMGQRLRLSPLMVFLSFILWGWLWGIPGMILSTPIMATIRIVLENIESLRPVAIIISNAAPSDGAEDGPHQAHSPPPSSPTPTRPAGDEGTR